MQMSVCVDMDMQRGMHVHMCVDVHGNGTSVQACVCEMGRRRRSEGGLARLRATGAWRSGAPWRVAARGHAPVHVVWRSV